MKPILIDSLHINTGGALMILNHFVNCLVKRDIEFVLLKDDRCPKLESEDKIKKLITADSSIKTRRRFYNEAKGKFCKILCLGNIPPMCKMDVPTYTYIHNVNLLKIPSDFSFKLRLKSLLKRFFIKYYAQNTDFWIVQTTNTKQLVKEYLTDEKPILIYPFFKTPKVITSSSEEDRKDYIFVGEHTFAKGHIYLIEAWRILSREGFPHFLHLTIGSKTFKPVVDEAIRNGAKIINHGYIPQQEIFELYTRCKATIYPSLNESLGLGIIEAINSGCDVIGCDLPYMHSVCSPSAVFQPQNPDSIKEAVLQYENQATPRTAIKIRDMADELIDLLLSPDDHSIH